MANKPQVCIFSRGPGQDQAEYALSAGRVPGEGSGFAVRGQTCSMKVAASRSVSDIFKRTITTARRRRQKDAVDSFSSCTRLFLVVMTPMAYSLRHMLMAHETCRHCEPCIPQAGTQQTDAETQPLHS